MSPIEDQKKKRFTVSDFASSIQNPVASAPQPTAAPSNEVSAPEVQDKKPGFFERNDELITSLLPAVTGLLGYATGGFELGAAGTGEGIKAVNNLRKRRQEDADKREDREGKESQFMRELERQKQQNQLQAERDDKKLRLEFLKLDRKSENQAKSEAERREFEMRKLALEQKFKEKSDERRAALDRDLAKLKPSEYQKIIDREGAKDAAKWQTKDKFLTQSKLKALDDVIQKLDTRGDISGAGVGLMENIPLVGSQIRKTFLPTSVQVQQDIELAIQETLKDTLGAQFAEREGMRIFERTFDPSLPESVNKERAMRLANNLKNIARARAAQAEYIAKNKTLDGYEGLVINPDAMTADDVLASNIPSSSMPTPAKAASEMTDDEVRQEYERMKKQGLVE